MDFFVTNQIYYKLWKCSTMYNIQMFSMKYLIRTLHLLFIFNPVWSKIGNQDWESRVGRNENIEI